MFNDIISRLKNLVNFIRVMILLESYYLFSCSLCSKDLKNLIKSKNHYSLEIYDNDEIEES